MKIGSLVECVDNSGCMMPEYTPRVNYPYTIEDIIKDEEDGRPILLLLEINTPIYKNNIRYGFDAERFRELLPPMQISIEQILEQPCEI